MTDGRLIERRGGGRRTGREMMWRDSGRRDLLNIHMQFKDNRTGVGEWGGFPWQWERKEARGWEENRRSRGDGGKMKERLAEKRGRDVEGRGKGRKRWLPRQREARDAVMRERRRRSWEVIEKRK